MVLGGYLAASKRIGMQPRIRADRNDAGVECWVISQPNDCEHWIPCEMRPSWSRYLPPRPRGRKRAAEPSVRMALDLPVRLAHKLDAPRGARNRRIVEIIEQGLMRAPDGEFDFQAASDAHARKMCKSIDHEVAKIMKKEAAHD